jgi:hypothetical protein
MKLCSLKILQEARDSLSKEEEIRSYNLYMIGAMTAHITPENMEIITKRGVEYAREKV